MIIQLRTEDVQPGTIIRFLSGNHLITSIEPYDGPHDFVHGVARSDDGWGISLCDGMTVDAYVTDEVRA